MVKILVSAVAIMALMSSAAMACSGHKSGGKGSGATASAPASIIDVVAGRSAA